MTVSDRPRVPAKATGARKGAEWSDCYTLWNMIGLDSLDVDVDELEEAINVRENMGTGIPSSDTTLSQTTSRISQQSSVEEDHSLSREGSAMSQQSSVEEDHSLSREGSAMSQQSSVEEDHSLSRGGSAMSQQSSVEEDHSLSRRGSAMSQQSTVEEDHSFDMEGGVTLVRTGITDGRQGHQHGQEQQNIDSEYALDSAEFRAKQTAFLDETIAL